MKRHVGAQWLVVACWIAKCEVQCSNPAREEIWIEILAPCWERAVE